MNCPKCGKEMYSKYRDGGSVHICYKCINNFNADFEMKNPNHPSNRPPPKLVNMTFDEKVLDKARIYMNELNGWHYMREIVDYLLRECKIAATDGLNAGYSGLHTDGGASKRIYGLKIFLKGYNYKLGDEL